MGDLAITEELARFVAATRFEDIPEAVRHEAKRAILNMFGTAIAGCREDAIEIALASFAELGGAPQARVFGRGERLDPLSAAFLNAASANIADFDDTHVGTVIHPTAPIAPPLFALAERRTVTGRTLITAFALGVEIACRVGNAISPRHYRRGWHITATCGVLGAAGAASKALGLDQARTRDALGTAATQASGLVECLGTMAKSVGVGNASRNGLWSALLAERGFTGPQRPIEGSQGFLSAMADEVAQDALAGGLGASWQLMRNTYKPYPCGVVINPVIDACLALREERGLAPDAIERIEVVGNPLLAQRADRAGVTSGREAQVSLQHSAAVALIFGPPGLGHYTDDCLQDARVRALASKVAVSVDADIAIEAAKVTLTTFAGRQLAAEVRHARGSLERPLTDQELDAKFEELASRQLPRARIGRLREGVWTLDRLSDAAEILPYTSPA